MPTGLIFHQTKIFMIPYFLQTMFSLLKKRFSKKILGCP